MCPINITLSADINRFMMIYAAQTADSKIQAKYQKKRETHSRNVNIAIVVSHFPESALLPCTLFQFLDTVVVRAKTTHKTINKI